MIYFDNSATSPVDEEVLEAMLPYLKEEYGNPSSKYYCKAVNARNAVEEARIQVAKLMGAKSDEIRDRIISLGYSIKDTKDGIIVKKEN